jgi:hypothetical protein
MKRMYFTGEVLVSLSLWRLFNLDKRLLLRVRLICTTVYHRGMELTLDFGRPDVTHSSVSLHLLLKFGSTYSLSKV